MNYPKLQQKQHSQVQIMQISNPIQLYTIPTATKTKQKEYNILMAGSSKIIGPMSGIYTRLLLLNGHRHGHNMNIDTNGPL
jgi:hypothetical protein